MLAKPISIKLDDDERAALARAAASQKRSAHFIAREAIREYLKREEMRQSFIADADAAWADYRATGEHLTLNEFADWADELERKPAAALPECHK